MTDNIKIYKRLLDGTLQWIYDHTENAEEYARALKRCHFTKAEAMDELLGCCCGTKDEVLDILEGIY